LLTFLQKDPLASIARLEIRLGINDEFSTYFSACPLALLFLGRCLLDMLLCSCFPVALLDLTSPSGVDIYSKDTPVRSSLEKNVCHI
jgi:hypothetical protein